MDHCCVVASAELFADRGVRNTEFLPQDIHNDLPRLYILFLPRLFVDALFGDLIVLGDTAYDLVDRDPLVGPHIVLNECTHIRLGHPFAFELGFADDHIEYPFEFSDVAADALCDELDYVVGNREPVLLDLGLDDGDTGLDVGLRYFRDHSGGETSLEALFEARQERRMLIGREDDLLIAVVERIEKVKELLLRLLGVRDELHVIHDEHVVLAVLVLEAVRATGAHGIDVIDSEALRGHIENLLVRVRFLEMIPYRLNEVRLAAPRRAVNEERVVRKAGTLEDGLRGGACELVEGADDERFERIAGVQVVAFVDVKGFEVEGGVLGRLHAPGLPLGGGCRPVDHILDGPHGRVQPAEGLQNELAVLFHEPLLHDLRRDRYLHGTSVAPRGVGVAEPRAEARLSGPELDLYEGGLPEFAVTHVFDL